MRWFWFWTFRRQPHKMIKHTQMIHPQEPTNCLSVFDHFMGICAWKGKSETLKHVLSTKRSYILNKPVAESRHGSDNVTDIFLEGSKFKIFQISNVQNNCLQNMALIQRHLPECCNKKSKIKGVKFSFICGQSKSFSISEITHYWNWKD